MNHRISMLALLLALLPGLVFSAGLIECCDKCEPYKIVDAKITGGWESALWTIEPESQADFRTAADGKSVFFVAPPGAYTLRVIGVNFTDKKIAQDKKVITIGKVEPNPPSPPDPPAPPPTPIGKKQVLFFLESSQLDDLPAEQRKIVASVTFRQAITDQGHTILGLFDPDSANTAPKDLLPWFRAIGGKQLPVVGLSPIGGGNITIVPLPANQAGMLKLLEEGN